MISAAELTRMRAVAQRSMPGTAVIQSGTLTSDGGGGYTDSFAAAGTVPCRVAPMISMNESEIGERISADADWMITLPAGTSVSSDDRLVTDGGTFTVVGVRGPRSYEVTRRVEARQLS